MKKLLVLFLSLFTLVSFRSESQVEKEFSIHYNLDDFKINRNDDMIKIYCTPMLTIDLLLD